jgi:hypothetical protein
MPLIIANNWNALREGIEEDSEGNKRFTGSIVVTFWLDKKIDKFWTGDIKEEEAQKGATGTIVKRMKKSKDGNKVYTSFVKVTFEHQLVVQKVTPVKIGFVGWQITLPSSEIVCLPKGRGQMKEILVEKTKEENVENKSKDNPKSKFVRCQPDELLEAIFTI